MEVKLLASRRRAFAENVIVSGEERADREAQGKG